MKLEVSKDIAAEDIPAVSLSLYHTAKSVAAADRVPENVVEFALNERANEVFGMYLRSMKKSILEIMEKEQ